jgi:hypothetical protein
MKPDLHCYLKYEFIKPALKFDKLVCLQLCSTSVFFVLRKVKNLGLHKGYITDSLCCVYQVLINK